MPFKETTVQLNQNMLLFDAFEGARAAGEAIGGHSRERQVLARPPLLSPQAAHHPRPTRVPHGKRELRIGHAPVASPCKQIGL